ncbi:MAG TPA: hypothetical protein VD997_12675 [Phycisphaerales bacterium]|nr:hypothetical protein [Phycisphaerales bacterium]
MVRWKRVLRSASSERFLAMREGRDAAAVDLHYLADGTVAGTLILLEGSGLTEEHVPEILKQLDDDFLPGVDLGSGSVMFTVVAGRLVGNYEGAEEK